MASNMIGYLSLRKKKTFVCASIRAYYKAREDEAVHSYRAGAASYRF